MAQPLHRLAKALGAALVLLLAGPACAAPRVIAPSGDATGAADTAAFQAAMQAGGVYALKAGGTYYLARQVAWSHDGSGFAAQGGRAKIVVLTGPGQFDQSDYAHLLGTNRIVFYDLGHDRPVLSGLVLVQQANPAVRSVNPIVWRKAANIRLENIELPGSTIPIRPAARSGWTA
ncbi:MAG: hypothetical protein WDM92_12185 [Caulobacteraceae bacterium]